MFIKYYVMADPFRLMVVLFNWTRFQTYSFAANVMLPLVTKDVMYCAEFQLFIDFGM